MLPLWQIVHAVSMTIYILLILFIFYTSLLANNEATGLNGRISKLLYVTVPQHFKRVVSDVLGPTVFCKLVATYNYTVYKKNPIMQLL